MCSHRQQQHLHLFQVVALHRPFNNTIIKMKLVSIILTALPLATSSSSRATHIRGGRYNNRELWQWGGGRNNNNSDNQWGNDGYDSSSTSHNDGYSHSSSSGGSSSHGGSSSKSKPKKASPPKPKPKPAPKPKGHSASKPSSSSSSHTSSWSSGHTSGDYDDSDKPVWYDDEWGDFYDEVSGYRQSSLISSKLAHYRDNNSRGIKIGLVSSLFALVALASVLVAKKIRRNRRKIPTIDANALSVDADDTSSNDSRGEEEEEEEESVDYERTMAQITAYVENYVEMTDQQRRKQQQQQQSSLGIPPRPPCTDRYRSKLMGKGNIIPAAPDGAVSFGRDANRLSVGSLDFYV